MISKELLIELKNILKAEFNLDINEKELPEIGNLLIRYYDWMLKIENTNHENGISRS